MENERERNGMRRFDVGQKRVVAGPMGMNMGTTVDEEKRTLLPGKRGIEKDVEGMLGRGWERQLTI